MVTKKKLLVIIIIVAISSTIAFSLLYKEINLKNCMNGYIVYAAKEKKESSETNLINVYDMKGDKTLEYIISGYEQVYSINKYYGGNFCCLGIKQNKKNNEILLFKDNKLEKFFPVSNNIEKAQCHNDSIYFLSNRELYVLKSNEGKPILFTTDTVDYFDVNENGNIAIAERISATELMLYCYKENKKKDIGIVSACFGWISSDALLVEKDKKLYIVSISDDKWVKQNYTDDFMTSITVYEAGGKVLNWFYARGSEINVSCGITDVDKKICYRYAFSNRHFNYGNIGEYSFIWCTDG